MLYAHSNEEEMVMEKKLPISFEPYKEESLDSYIIRLTEANHYSTPDWIKTMIDMMPGCRLQFLSDKELQALSDITDTAIDKLEYISLKRSLEKKSAQPIEIYNNPVPLYFVNKKSARICPLCLKEKPFIRQIWDLYSYTACSKHGVYLIDKCPSCGKKISWSRSNICICLCGADIRNAAVELADNIMVSSIIEEKLFPSEQKQDNNKSIIDSLSLLSFLKILSIFSGLLKGQIDATGKFLNKHREPQIMNNLLVKAYSLLEDWPLNFIKILDKQLSDPIHNQVYFKLLHRVLKREFEDSNESFIYEAFLKYATETWKGGYISQIRSLDKGVKMKRNYLSMVDACKILHVRHETVERLIEEGQLDGEITEVGSRKRVLISKASVEQFKVKMEHGITLKEAAYRLDMGHESVAELARKGYLTALVHPSDGHASWLISLDSLNMLLSNIERCLLYKDGVTIGFYHVMRRLSVHSFSIVDVIEEILTKRLNPVILCPAPGLSRFLFLQADVDKLLEDNRNKKKCQMLTVIDVADNLHVKQEVAAFWIDRGIITAENIIDGDRKKRLVLPNELDNFKNKYVTSSQIAKVYAVSPKNLIKNLSEKKIIPISGPNIDGGRQYLYKRNDIFYSLF